MQSHSAHPNDLQPTEILAALAGGPQSVRPNVAAGPAEKGSNLSPPLGTPLTKNSAKKFFCRKGPCGNNRRLEKLFVKENRETITLTKTWMCPVAFEDM